MEEDLYIGFLGFYGQSSILGESGGGGGAGDGDGGSGRGDAGISRGSDSGIGIGHRTLYVHHAEGNGRLLIRGADDQQVDQNEVQ